MPRNKTICPHKSQNVWILTQVSGLPDFGSGVLILVRFPNINASVQILAQVSGYFSRCTDIR